MKKNHMVIAIIGAAALLGITGCSPSDTESGAISDPVVVSEEPPQMEPSPQPETDKPETIEISEQKTDTPDPADFKEGVSLDMTEYVQSFFTEEMAEAIQHNMEAIVQNDDEAFKQGMSEDYVEPNLSVKSYIHPDGGAVEFEDVHFITYLKDRNRIQIFVSYLLKTDEELTRGSFEYSLIPVKGEEDHWVIATMD
ncbi:hypothetical protein M3231_20665 [Neobacillus mesonae]|nr:hypothetical protein [Neobacillus mesonae]